MIITDKLFRANLCLSPAALSKSVGFQTRYIRKISIKPSWKHCSLHNWFQRLMEKMIVCSHPLDDSSSFSGLTPVASRPDLLSHSRYSYKWKFYQWNPQLAGPNMKCVYIVAFFMCKIVHGISACSFCPERKKKRKLRV